MPISVEKVDYTSYAGDGDIDSWIAKACEATGLPKNDAWVLGDRTLCQRESSYRPNAINKTDGNAHGFVAADGYPLGCSRGVAQCIPTTFAEYHVENTSKSIYNPVANIAASMQYVRQRYHVSSDGSDLAAKVQQADPTRRRKGY